MTHDTTPGRGNVKSPAPVEDEDAALPTTGIGAAVTKGNTKTEQPGCQGLGAPVEERPSTSPESTRPSSPGAQEDLEGAPL